MTFTGFADEHARLLEAVFREEDWRRAVADGFVETARARMLTPSRPVSVFRLPVEQLRRMNESAVRARIAAGERDEERLLEALGTWPAQWPCEVPVRLSFLGLNLGFDCDMEPRCIYCNAPPVEPRMCAGDWLELVRQASSPEGEGPYVFITGGEPLLHGGALWGKEGLVRAATRAGAACNINTNALALTPRVALALVSAGLLRAHISLDTHRPEVQDAICRRAGRWAQVVRGIHNLQIARALLGAEHPVIHINCVLTRLIAADFPDFLRYLLHAKPLGSDALSADLDVHLIPVGGEQNRTLRLTAREHERFFTETWDEANEVWLAYQEESGVPEDKRGPLHEKVPYMSPFHRVRRQGDLRSWSERAAEGRPADSALTPRCYVAPTQAFILPDGAQYWCGGHATSRPEPVGSVPEGGVQENIRRGIGQLAHLPGPQCRSCAGATLAINQSVEDSLRELIRQWLNPDADGQAADAPDDTVFE